MGCTDIIYFLLKKIVENLVSKIEKIRVILSDSFRFAYIFFGPHYQCTFSLRRGFTNKKIYIVTLTHCEL